MPALEPREARIKYDVQGYGDQELLMINGGLVADAFEPLATELIRGSSALRVVNLRRRGYGQSSRAAPPYGIEDHVRDCQAVMDSLNFKKTHIVGHSLGGLIALQLASEASERIASLTLIEPALTAFLPNTPQSTQPLSKLGAIYQSGDRVGALDYFMRGISGDDYRKTMDKTLPPGWFEQAVEDIDTFIQIDLPAVRTWRLVAGDRLRSPILSIYGLESRWGGQVAFGLEFDRLLHSWFAQTESLPVNGAYHWPHVTNTSEVALGIIEFVRKYAE